MTKNILSFALCAAASVALPALTLADAERTVVWLTAERHPGDAVRLEAEAAGYRLVVADAPTGEDGGARLANARARGRVLGGTFTVYVETQGTPTVFVIAADGTIAHAPLSNTRFSQRALALVAMSLVEELGEGQGLVDVVAESAEVAEGVETPASEPAARASEPAATAPEPAAPPSAESPAAPAEQAPVLGAPTQADDIVPPTVVVVDAPPGSEVLIDVHPATDAPAATETRTVFFGGDLVPFVGSSTFTRGQAVRRLSLNFVGFDRGLDGFEIGAVANLHREDVYGVEIAGMLNGNGGDLGGVQIAGIANVTRGDALGAQLSGGFNFLGGSLHGGQLGPLNMVRADVRGGAQAGVANYVGRDMHGGQLGMLNFARGQAHGAQAGVLNIAGDVRGAQLGTLNIARGDVQGAQVGLANFEKGDGGVQVGLVNISSNADFAVGLINIVRHGRTQLEFLGNDGGLIFAGLKHGGRHFHSIYSLGVNALAGEPQLALGLGYGVRATPSERIFLDFDALAHALIDSETGNAGENVEILTSARVLVGVHLVPRLSLVVGASLDVLHTQRATRTNGFGQIDAVEVHDGVDLGGFRALAWPSFMVGLQVL